MNNKDFSASDDSVLLSDETAELLERAGMWRRAASRWLTVFDLLQSDYARECVAQRREACLMMANTSQEDKRRKASRMINRVKRFEQ